MVRAREIEKEAQTASDLQSYLSVKRVCRAFMAKFNRIPKGSTLYNFSYFPQDANWATRASRLLRDIGYGGSDFGEVHRVLKNVKIGDADAWRRGFRKMAEHLEEKGNAALEKRYTETARKSFYRASYYYRSAMIFQRHGLKELDNLYDKSVETFQKYAPLETPPIERVEVRYKNDTFPGYFCPPKIRRSERVPVCIFGALGTEGGAAEFSPMNGPPEALTRGIATLFLDGYGGGANLRYKKMYCRPDIEEPFAAVVDWLQARPDVDPDKIALYSSDFGAYFAARAAAYEKRIKALVIVTACYDALKDLYDYGMESHRPGLQNALGAKTPEETRKMLKQYNLKGIAEKITCPLLIMHGAETLVYPSTPAKRLFKEAQSQDKELHLLKSGHTIMDIRQEFMCDTFDWLSDRIFR